MKANHHNLFYHSIFLRFHSTFDFFNERHPHSLCRGYKGVGKKRFSLVVSFTPRNNLYIFLF